jgi:hypothetical protein
MTTFQINVPGERQQDGKQFRIMIKWVPLQWARDGARWWLAELIAAPRVISTSVQRILQPPQYGSEAYRTPYRLTQATTFDGMDDVAIR